MLRFRLAPTPSGFLHIGNAFNFILTALLARNADASLRLRIDDADATRARPDYLADIFESLAWLDIGWQEGPRNVADHQARFSQGLRGAEYRNTLQSLMATGLVFACECSRKDIVTSDSDGQYPGTCRDKHLPLTAPNTALRLRTSQEAVVRFNDAVLGPQVFYPHAVARDPIVRRRDGLPAYHIASLTDDLNFGVTHIVRGEDLLSSTAAQLFISQTFGGTTFERVLLYHHSLLKDEKGMKLSKSAGATSLRAMRESGASAADVYGRFSRWMKWPRAAENFVQAMDCFANYGFEMLKQTAASRASAK